MEMEIQREALLSAIKLVLPAMTRKELFDQSNKIAFAAGRVVAFNDAVAILHPLPGGLDLAGAVDGQHLHDLLNKVSAESIKLIVEGSDLNLRAGRSRATFHLQEVTLPFDSVDTTGELIELPETFVDQLRWVSANCARDMSRPALTCVLVDGGYMQATDSYRISRVRHGDVDLPKLTLPVTQVEVLVDYPIRRVAKSDSGEWVRFETDDETTLCVRALSAEFPDLTSFYTVEGREIQLSTALTQAIDRARIFSRREHTIDEEITVSMRQNQISVEARYDGGSFSEVVRCDGAVEGPSFTIHPKFLSAALESGTKCILGGGSVKFSGADWDHVVALRS